jgi:hypothetical protein
MSREAVEQVMDAWMSDVGFRRRLRADPDGAVRSLGVTLDADERAALHNVDWSLSDEELQARMSKIDGTATPC